MGKNNKKSFYKKQVRPFIKENRVLIAALGGVAAGITLTNILGTEKAQEILHTVEDSISKFADKVVKTADGAVNGTAVEKSRKKEPVAS